MLLVSSTDFLAHQSQRLKMNYIYRDPCMSVVLSVVRRPQLLSITRLPKLLAGF